VGCARSSYQQFPRLVFGPGQTIVDGSAVWLVISPCLSVIVNSASMTARLAIVEKMRSCRIRFGSCVTSAA